MDQQYEKYMQTIPANKRGWLDERIDKDNDVDRDLTAISKFIGAWESKLAVPLGLTREDIDDIKVLDMPQRKKKVLETWQKTNMMEATYGKLLGVFVEAGEARAAMKLCDIVTAIKGDNPVKEEAKSPSDDVTANGAIKPKIPRIDEMPKLADDDTEYFNRKPVYPPKQDTPEYAKLLQFCDEVEIILHVVNKNELRAAVRFMEAPIQHYKKAVCNFPYPSMYVGMFAGKKTALVQTRAGNYCRPKITEAVKAFKNAKYIILVGVCYAFSQDKYKLGDVLVSNAISDMKSWKMNDDGSIQDRGQTIKTESFLYNTFCNDETHDPPFYVSNTRQSEVHSGLFVSFSVLMNNKEMRDKFHSVRDYALAGEMEGGIALEFVTDEKKFDGTIIIKAAADYGDSTKEKNWQFTAAMAAFHYTHSKLNAVNLPVKAGKPHIAIAKPRLQRADTPMLLQRADGIPMIQRADCITTAITGKKRMNCDELACWLINEGINENDVEILRELGINERQFLRLDSESEKLNNISQATKEEIFILQEEMKDLM